jgi:excisionase family DNA binding protein
MTTFTLKQAADEAGVSKSTIFRAVRAGRLSAARTDDGGFAIDASELLRVYPPKQSNDARHSPAAQDATADDVDLRIRNAALEAEIKVLRERADELRQERDRWAAQAERLALPKPNATPDTIAMPAPVESSATGATSVPTIIATPRRSWLPWRRSA